jgi:hypothetical protein
LIGLDAAAAADRLVEEVYALRHRMDADPPGAAEYQDYFEPSLFILDLSILALSDLVRLAAPGSLRPQRPHRPHRRSTAQEPLKSTDNNSRTFMIAFAIIVGLLMLIGMLSE